MCPIRSYKIQFLNREVGAFVVIVTGTPLNALNEAWERLVEYCGCHPSMYESYHLQFMMEV